MEAREVIVVGGGVAGISAALHLAEAGLRPTLLDGSKAAIWPWTWAGVDIESASTAS